MKQKKRFIGRCLCLMAFLTNIAMLQNIYSDVLAYLPMAGVLLMIGCIIVTGTFRKLSRTEIKFCLLGMLFVCISAVLELTGNNYLSANLTYPILLCTLLFYIGHSSGNILEQEEYIKVLCSFIASTLIVSIVVYSKYYVGFNWGLPYSVYKFRGQLSQAIVFSSFALLICVKPGGKIKKIFKIAVLTFSAVLLLMMKCRAAIVEIVIGILFFVTLRETDKRLKRMVIGLGIAFVVLLFVNKDFYNLIVNQVIFYGRDISNLDDVSSGRLTILSSFPALWSGHEILGIGNFYFECFLLNAILQYGIIVGGMAVIIGVYPAIWSWKHRNSTKNREVLAFLVVSSAASFVCGLFEAIAPLGPGIKFFILWLTFGYAVASENKG